MISSKEDDERTRRWGIVRRQPIYEKDRHGSGGSVGRLKPGREIARSSFPEGYRHLAYLQTKLGFQIKLDLPQLKGAEVETLYRHGKRWLDGAASAFPDR